MEMHERIALVVEKTGLTKTAFAERLKLSQPFVSKLCTGGKIPSDRTISDICREFNVSERWLRFGHGEMFVKQTTQEEISAFVGDILSGEPDFRQRFIAVLARMSQDEWKCLEKKVLELADEIKKASP